MNTDGHRFGLLEVSLCRCRKPRAHMAAGYDDSITSDGRRYAVKVAINGDYFNGATRVPPPPAPTGRKSPASKQSRNPALPEA
jgi:hypothetical protein